VTPSGGEAKYLSDCPRTYKHTFFADSVITLLKVVNYGHKQAVALHIPTSADSVSAFCSKTYRRAAHVVQFRLEVSFSFLH